MYYRTAVELDFLVAICSYNQQIITPCDIGCLDKAIYLAPTCLFVSHIPCNLYQLVYIHASLHYEITLAFALIVIYLVNRSAPTV